MVNDNSLHKAFFIFSDVCIQECYTILFNMGSLTVKSEYVDKLLTLLQEFSQIFVEYSLHIF